MYPTGEVHPAAAMFPMMSPDELADLADDIKANGLLQPIVLDADGTLIDGRNRMAACAAAGVTPRFTQLNGHDPIEYVLASNVMRRHMTQGQRSMVVATVRKVIIDDFHGRWAEAARVAGVPKQKMAQAALILEHAKDQVELVISGATPFDAAYRVAQARESEVRALAEQAEEERRNLVMLQERAPDLAELVVEERMTLEEAMGAYKVRHHEEIQKEEEAVAARRRLTANFAEALKMIDGVLLTDPGQVANRWERGIIDVTATPFKHLWSADGIRDVSRRLSVMADVVDQRGGSLG